MLLTKGLEDMENSTREVNPLLLWSWQEPDFSLTEGTVDHGRSYYYNTVRGVPESYKELSVRLGTDQFVWCYTRQDGYNPGRGCTRVEWQLEVPEDRVLRKACGVVWHCIVWCNGGEHGLVGKPPKKFEYLWRKLASDFGLKLDDFNREFYNFWYNKTNEELWDALFLDTVHGDCTDVLLRHPVEKGWVKTCS